MANKLRLVRRARNKVTDTATRERMLHARRQNENIETYRTIPKRPFRGCGCRQAEHKRYGQAIEKSPRHCRYSTFAGWGIAAPSPARLFGLFDSLFLALERTYPPCVVAVAATPGDSWRVEQGMGLPRLIFAKTSRWRSPASCNTPTAPLPCNRRVSILRERAGARSFPPALHRRGPARC
jgi:hypothetical protein